MLGKLWVLGVKEGVVVLLAPTSVLSWHGERVERKWSRVYSSYKERQGLPVQGCHKMVSEN